MKLSEAGWRSAVLRDHQSGPVHRGHAWVLDHGRRFRCDCGAVCVRDFAGKIVMYALDGELP